MIKGLKKTALVVVTGVAVGASSGAFADAATVELIEAIKLEFASHPGVTGGYSDGVVTLTGHSDDPQEIERLEQKLLSLDGVDEVRSTVTN